MDAYQKAQLTVQIAAAVGLLVTLYFQYRQLRLMSDQLDEVRESTTAGHILSLLNMMEMEDIRLARVMVHTRLSKKPFSTWTEEEIQSASKVCNIYASAGTMLKSGLVPPEPIIESWGFSLRLTYEILEPFISDMRQSAKVGAEYWKDFDWVYQMVIAAEAKKQARNTAAVKKRGFPHLRHKNVERNGAA